jgi:uncharacterized protein
MQMLFSLQSHLDFVFSESEVRFIRSQWLCRIASSSLDGWPHNVPVGYVFDGPAFYITSEPGAKKLKNMAENNRVAIIIDVAKPRRAIMVQGKATLFERGEEFERIMELVYKQWGGKRWNEGEQVAVRIDPTRKASWGI